MKRLVLLILLAATVSPLYSDSVNYPVIGPLMPVRSQPAEVGFFSPVNSPVTLSEPAREMVEDSVFWSWMTIGGFGATTLSFIITHSVDRTVGGVLSLASTGFWTVSNLATAFTHRKISMEIRRNDSQAQRPAAAGIASLASGVLGLGALTAVSLVFGDTSGAAEITAYICYGLSAVAGGYGVFKTFEYASAADTDLSFF